jgi:hypothetical protein
MIQPRYLERQPPPRIPNPRSAKNASQTRKVRNNRARYTSLVRMGGVLFVALALLMGYVMLTSNMTSLTYAVAKAHHDREALEEQTARLDDKLIAMRSDERLAKLAAKLGMHEPAQFAVVKLTAPAVAHRGFPVFASLAGWFGTGTGPQPRER